MILKIFSKQFWGLGLKNMGKTQFDISLSQGVERFFGDFYPKFKFDVDLNLGLEMPLQVLVGIVVNLQATESATTMSVSWFVFVTFWKLTKNTSDIKPIFVAYFCPSIF